MKKIIIFPIIICLCSTLPAQTVRFLYDAAGNRVERYIDMTAPGLRSATIAAEEETEETSENTPLKELQDLSLANPIHIYPNPTDGLLKVQIDNLQENQKASVILMNMQGQTVLSRSAVRDIVELDMSTSAQGIYIMRISIDEKNTEWKIIKK
ncbi:MAG: T9SS type A sorting domain-containing protein [Prevotellaceae bacterium]|jgi:hypothetical protein|nr:T9SS type A sorting domain-containing protein [Prevotellaceae bacterium]